MNGGNTSKAREVENDAPRELITPPFAHGGLGWMTRGLGTFETSSHKLNLLHGQRNDHAVPFLPRLLNRIYGAYIRRQLMCTSGADPGGS